MSLKKWMDSKVKRIKLGDIQCIKIGSVAFALMVAKLWTPLLSLEWYWYGIIAVLAVIKPVYTIFKK